MGTYWLIWLGAILLGFAVPEGVAVARRQWADTLSDNLRVWFRVRTAAGARRWLVAWSSLLLVWVWLLGHILNWWP